MTQAFSVIRSTLVRSTSLGLGALAASLLATPSRAAIVSPCSGVSLPRSVITGIMAGPLNGIATPVQSRVNDLISALDGTPDLPEPLDLNVTSLLATAASGRNFTLQALATNGSIVGPADSCDVTAASYQLDAQAGISIGGNSITGLGSGTTASAGTLGSIALGNGASTSVAATDSIALGARASATVANSVAFGADSTATRGALTNYTAPGLAAAQTSAGEFSVGAAGATRQITNVAAGSQSTDAVNLAQLAGAISTAAAAVPIRYSDPATPTTPNGGGATNDVTLVGGAAGAVTLHNVGNGTVAAGSTDAVNGGQLFATQTGIGDIVTVVGGTYDTTTGAYTGPSYNTVGGTTATTVQTAFDNYNTAIDNLNNGAAGLVQQTGGSPGVGPITVGAATGGTSVSIAGTGGTRVLSGLSDGVLGSDAATVAQLASVTGGAFNAVNYDVVDGTRQNSITLQGGAPGAVTINNVADGTVAAGSTQAVNGGQLATTNAQVTNITNGTANAGAFRSDNTAGAAPSVATGANASAGGFGSSATGTRSLAVGNGAASSGTNSVALGANSTDGGVSNVVSIGGVGSERRLTNVGPGLNGTDAVNLSQLQAATASFQTTTNGLQGQINQLDFDLGRAKRRANAGTAGALAIAGLPQPFTEGAGMVAGGVGYWQGQVAFAVGVSKIVSEAVIVKAGASVSGRGTAGGNAGVGFQF